MKAHVKSFLVVCCFILVGVFIYQFFSVNSADKNSSSNMQVGKTINNWSQLEVLLKDLKSLEGKAINQDVFKNKLVIVNFWASWCAPCIEEVPSLVSLTRKNDEIVILAISGDSQLDDVYAFLKSFPDFAKPPFVQVWAENKKWLELFSVIKLPESYIFNKQGEMVKRISGTINWNTPDSIEYFRSFK